jgi:AAA domain-containing protein
VTTSSGTGGGRGDRASQPDPRGSAAGSASRRKLELLDVQRMVEEEPPPIEWRIDGLAVDGALTMLAGREGEGKSLLALALASAVTRGGDVAGFACKPGRALIIDVENGEREAHRRVHRLRPDPEKLSYCVGPLNLSSELDLLAELLDRLENPELVVLDSFRPLIPGIDENDSRVDADLAPLRDLVRAHRSACILLHHASKQQGGDYRGSTAIGAAVELGFTLSSKRDADPRRCLSCWKSRPAPRVSDRWLAIRQAADGSPEIVAAEAPAPADRSGENLVGQIVAALASGAQARADLAELVGEPRSQPSGAFSRALNLAVQRGAVVMP